MKERKKKREWKERCKMIVREEKSNKGERERGNKNREFQLSRREWKSNLSKFNLILWNNELN